MGALERAGVRKVFIRLFTPFRKEMEETNIQQTQEPQKSKSYKKWLIIAVIFIVIILFFTARFMLNNNLVEKASNEVRLFLLNGIYLNSSMDKSSISLEQAKVQVDKNDADLNKKFNEFKTGGEVQIEVLNRTFICGDGKIISPEEYANGIQCNLSTSIKTIGEGYTLITKRGRYALSEVQAESLKTNLYKYFYYVLQLNQEEPKDLNKIFAQTLDVLTYISESVIDTSTFINSIRKSEVYNLADEKLALSKIEQINNGLELPNEEQINNIGLKKNCIASFNEITKNSQIMKKSIVQTLFFSGPSPSRICENLEIYHKKNALRILEDAKSTQNPFIAIGDKLHLNILIKCSSEIFPTKDNSHFCRDSYIKEFDAKFSSV
jgi:hypothetical protein